MRLFRVIGLAVAVTALAPAALARAEDGPRTPPWAIRLEPGGFFTPDHLHPYGLVGMPPAAYLGVSLERTIAGPLRANVSGGVSLMLGWLVGGAIRYLALDEENANLSIGVGPLFAPDADFGRERLQIRGDNQRLRDLMDHWEQAVKSSLPPGIDVELEERVETREDAAQLAALFAHAEDRVRAFESVVPLELCNETMELTGTPAAFQGGFKKEQLLATLEALRRLLG